MKNLIPSKQCLVFITAICMSFSFLSCSENEDIQKKKSLDVNVSFPAVIKPDPQQTLFVNLYYNDITGSSVIDSSPDIQKEAIISMDNILNGLTVLFDDVQSNVDEIYVCAYVDINKNDELDAGDLAVFYDGIGVDEVEKSNGHPTNLAEKSSIELPLDKVYAEDELVIDIDGNIYKTVVIGEQEWFVENLKTTRFRNGDNIPTGHTADEWVNLMNSEDGTGSPAYAQNPEAIPEDGFLYNWFAVTDERELAPEGWRVPSDEDFKKLMKFVGMPDEELDLFTWAGRDTEIGTKLKSKEREMNGTDDYGFNGIPSGMRSGKGTYSRYGHDFFFWCSTEDQSGEEDAYLNGIRRALRDTDTGVIRQANTKLGGYAIRCVRDVE